MIDDFNTVKKQLSELAGVINSFKSESIQLRIVELILGRKYQSEESDDNVTTETKPKSRPRKPAAEKKRAGTPSQKKRKSAVGAGAVASLAQLAEGKFFDKPKTIGDIIEHCKHNLARTFKPNEFSGKLGRMVRNGELSRKKNADKQYEYKKP